MTASIRTWFRSRWDGSRLVSAMKMPSVRVSHPIVGVGNDEFPWEISVSTSRRFFASALRLELDRDTLVVLGKEIADALACDEAAARKRATS